MGDVLENGTILAGARTTAAGDLPTVRRGWWPTDSASGMFSGKLVGENTVIGCVVTNAAMNSAQATAGVWPKMELPARPSRQRHL